MDQNNYSEGFSKTMKNMNMPISQNVSRKNSQSDLAEGLDSIELNDGQFPNGEPKKKVVKKKIIKKIVKKKNPDGTDAPPQVTTVVLEKKINANELSTDLSTKNA